MSSIREEIFNAIEQSSQEINEPDLPELEKEYSLFIDSYIKNNDRIFYKLGFEETDKLIISTFQKVQKGFSFLFKNNKSDYTNSKIVVVGDIHCDFNSLKNIFIKLDNSEYEYFEKSYFIFLGDYIDRGEKPLETIRLLFKLKEILGDRCILLKGNHDDLKFNEEKNEYYSKVSPAETVDLFNQYIEKPVIKKIRQFFDHLPYFLLLKRANITFLMIHGSIPREDFINEFNLEQLVNLNIESIQSDPELLKTYKTLISMLWGDPVNVEYKKSAGESRFEFGSKQFEYFMAKHELDILIRGHEPKKYGHAEIFNNRLHTIFSSGGNNPNSYYSDSVPFPAFAIIDEKGELLIEQIYTYKIRISSNAIKTTDNKYEYILNTEKFANYNILLETNFEIANPNYIKNNNEYFSNPEFSVQISFSNISNSFPIDVEHLLIEIINSISK